MMKLLLLVFVFRVCFSVPARTKRQIDPDARFINSATCDFGTGEDVSMCDWKSEGSSLSWIASKGENAFWLGGPESDVNTKDDQGGYVVYETSSRPEKDHKIKFPELQKRDEDLRYRPDSNRIPKLPEKKEDNFAKFVSPTLEPTGPTGTCLSFQYQIHGLSASELKVYIRRVYREPVTSKNITKPNNGLDKLIGKEDDEEDSIMLWHHFDHTNNEWFPGETLYCYPHEHKLVFEGVAVEGTSLKRDYRGFIVIDDIKFGAFSDCGGHCTFDGSTCAWEQSQDDDFDWSLSRGSSNEATGPQRDHGSEMMGGIWGGYAVINSQNRRYKDAARLESRLFSVTRAGTPLCMRFWTHMYGPGVGALNIIYQPEGKKDAQRVLWSIFGDQGKRWYQGQVPIASAEKFYIIFEGIVGEHELGDIAIDDISFSPGSCVTSPQGANPETGDCTFNVDECNWVNPSSNEQLDEFDWQRVTARSGDTPDHDHTSGASTSGMYMRLHRTVSGVSQAGSRAWLISRIQKGEPEQSRCVSFWYFMQEPYIDASGPSLGSLRVYVRSTSPTESLIPIWRLDNHQGSSWKYGQALLKSENDYQVVFEGMWGSGRGNGIIAIDDVTFFDGTCETLPTGASAMKSDCSFSRDTCQWEDTSGNEFSSTGRNNFKSATISQRPANLPDHTYNAPVGYVFFDVVSATTITSVIKSPVIEVDEPSMCVSFWFSAFGRDESSTLKVLLQKETRQNTQEEPQTVWSIEAEKLLSSRPEWNYGQAAISTKAKFQILFSGSSENGGFALDDIKLIPGTCSTIPDTENQSSR